MVKVRNVKGHYNVPTGYSSWLNYWERKMNDKAEQCQKKGCTEKDDLVGGHVHKVGDEDTVYLVPICQEHNHYTFTDEYEVPGDMLLEVPEEDLVKDTLAEYLEDVIKSSK